MIFNPRAHPIHEDCKTGHQEVLLMKTAFTARETNRADRHVSQLLQAADAGPRPLYWKGMHKYGSDERKEAWDRWWLEVFGDTEEELIEQRSAMTSLYRRTPFFMVTRRRRMLARCILLDQMITRGHGLTTVWQ